MLSLFPELLFLGPFSALFIRLALGFVFGYATVHHFKSIDTVVRVFAIVEGAVAVALVLGAWTQLAAVLGVCLVGAWFILPKLRAVALGTALLSLVLSFTLLLTGAGPVAFDLPL
mgnify:CR=1 FL=1